MMIKIRSLSKPETLVVIGLMFLFLFTAPWTVQSGDTGELVTNSYFLRVSHPPGYPLWTLLYHIPTKYLSFGNPFYAAAIFTSAIALLWIGILLFRSRRKEFLASVLVLATTSVFWRYSILPDVFSLHLLFLVLVFFVFLNPEYLEKPWMIFLISLGVAHHHLILFAFPMFLFALLQGDGLRRKIAYSFFFGFVSLSIYGLLTLFHPLDYGSWGEVTTFKALLNHFLRTDYGTFQLERSAHEKSPVWVHFFIKTLLINCWSVLILLSFLLVRGQKFIRIHKWPLGILLLCTASYLLTFLVAGLISLDGFGETIFERFLLQPILFIFFMAFYILIKSDIKLPRWLALLILTNAGLNLLYNFRSNNYRNNTLIEDYALNLLRSLPSNAVYFSFGDTIGFATYYLQDVLKARPDIHHLHPSLATHWVKSQRHFPEILKGQSKSILANINVQDYPFFSNLVPNKMPLNLRLTYHGLLVRFSLAKDGNTQPDFECEVANSYNWRNRSQQEDFADFEISRVYDLEYGRCHFTHGLQLLSEGKNLQAITKLQEANKLSRFSATFLERLCYAYSLVGDLRKNACTAELENLLSFSHPQYYLFKYQM